jgi:hypothetical protein
LPITGVARRAEMGRVWTYVQRPTGYSARLAKPAPFLTPVCLRDVLCDVTGRERWHFGKGGVNQKLRLKRPVSRDFIITSSKAIFAHLIT